MIDGAPRPAHLKICLLNNYSMRQALSRYDEGTYPGQHLWGVVPPKDEIRWVLPFGMFDLRASRWAWFRRVRSLVLRMIGDPLQQIAAWAAPRHNVDVIYAADQWSGTLIGLLSRLRLSRKPYVVLVHHRPSSRWNSFCLRGASAALVLSDVVRAELERDTYRSRQVPVVLAPWGPETSWPGYTEADVAAKRFDFVSAGRSNRDHRALRDAAREFQLSGVIFDGLAREDYVRGNLVLRRAGAADYPEIVAAMAQSSAVVVPLADPQVLSGLTEIADAAALGIPVVVTRSPLLPFDITGLNAGLLLDSNSPADIAAAIRSIAAGAAPNRPRELAAKYNTAVFQSTLLRTMRAAIDQ